MPRSGQKQGNRRNGEQRPAPNPYSLRARRKKAAREIMLTNILADRVREESERKLKQLMLSTKR